MLEKEQLRKADIFSGLLFFFFGIFIISQAFQMPMKDSWGGVKNVWYVSPALLPLVIGSVITLLGAILARKGAKEVGGVEIKKMLKNIMSSKTFDFIASDGSIRFLAIAMLLIFYVYMSVPRVDFILCSMQFMIAFITMFYFDDIHLLKKLATTYTLLSIVFFLFLVTGLFDKLSAFIPYPADILTILFTAVYTYQAWSLSRASTELTKKFKTSAIVAFVTPFILGIVFRYFLLVPLIHEGLVVNIVEAIRYM